MKAKEYAAHFKSGNQTNEVLAGIVSSMIGEVHAIAQARNAKSNSAVLAILNELSQKWQAFIKEVEKYNKNHGIRPDGFENMIKKIFPDVYFEWKERSAFLQKL